MTHKWGRLRSQDKVPALSGTALSADTSQSLREGRVLGDGSFRAVTLGVPVTDHVRALCLVWNLNRPPAPWLLRTCGGVKNQEEENRASDEGKKDPEDHVLCV